MTLQQKHSYNMFLVVHVKFGRKSGMIPLGKVRLFTATLSSSTLQRTLATDRGFKERVREDMLVRLLDAFVWRNHGTLSIIITKSL